MLPGIDFDVWHVIEKGTQLLIMRFVGDDHRCRLEFPCLLGKQLHAVVGGEGVDLVSIAVLLDDIEGLGSNGTCAAKDAYLLFFHIG